MTPDEYMILANLTAPTKYKQISDDIIDPEIVHAWLGVTTECGESGDVVKKALIYEKEPDLINLDEEFGDKLWYIALYCHARGIDFDYLFTMNIAKLQKRFPNKFSAEQAINRDVVAERAVLEAHAKDDGADWRMVLTREFVKRTGRKPQPNDAMFYSDRDFSYMLDVDSNKARWIENKT
jgi:NTP pyrophosphatase (non-canonical NTP hydrolase)